MKWVWFIMNWYDHHGMVWSSWNGMIIINWYGHHKLVWSSWNGMTHEIFMTHHEIIWWVWIIMKWYDHPEMDTIIMKTVQLIIKWVYYLTFWKLGKDYHLVTNRVGPTFLDHVELDDRTPHAVIISLPQTSTVREQVTVSLFMVTISLPQNYT